MITKNKYQTLIMIFGISSVLWNKADGQTTVIHNHYTTEQGVPRLQIERSMVFSPDGDWLYAHHASIINFKGKLIALWSNGIKDEDSPGQRVVLRSF